MRRAHVFLATAFSVIATTGCSSGTSNCTPAYDYSLNVPTSMLQTSSGTPLCSKCGGLAEANAYECQSTCATPPASDEKEGGVFEAVTCIVDTCATAVLAKNVQCSAACGALFPGKTVNSCSIASGTVTCSLHQDETCP